jgi:hypothetical protein
MSIFREGGFWLSCRASVEWLSDAGDMAVAYFMAPAPSLFHNAYRNNVSQITGNVPRRFLDPKPFA